MYHNRNHPVSPPPPPRDSVRPEPVEGPPALVVPAKASGAPRARTRVPFPLWGKARMGEPPLTPPPTSRTPQHPVVGAVREPSFPRRAGTSPSATTNPRRPAHPHRRSRFRSNPGQGRGAGPSPSLDAPPPPPRHTAKAGIQRGHEEAQTATHPRHSRESSNPEAQGRAGNTPARQCVRIEPLCRHIST